MSHPCDTHHRSPCVTCYSCGLSQPLQLQRPLYPKVKALMHNVTPPLPLSLGPSLLHVCLGHLFIAIQMSRLKGRPREILRRESYERRKTGNVSQFHFGQVYRLVGDCLAFGSSNPQLQWKLSIRQNCLPDFANQPYTLPLVRQKRYCKSVVGSYHYGSCTHLHMTYVRVALPYERMAAQLLQIPACPHIVSGTFASCACVHLVFCTHPHIQQYHMNEHSLQHIKYMASRG